MFIMFNIHVGMCVHACMCIVHGALPDTPTPIHVWFGGWMDGWVDGWGQVKSLNILIMLT